MFAWCGNGAGEGGRGCGAGDQGGDGDGGDVGCEGGGGPEGRRGGRGGGASGQPPLARSQALILVMPIISPSSAPP